MESIEARLSTAHSYLWLPFVQSKAHTTFENANQSVSFSSDWTLILVVAASTKPVPNPSTNSIHIFWKTVTAKAVTEHKKNKGIFQRTLHTRRSCKKHCVGKIQHDIILLHNGLRNEMWIRFHKCTATRKLSWICVYNFSSMVSQLLVSSCI